MKYELHQLVKAKEDIWQDPTEHSPFYKVASKGERFKVVEVNTEFFDYKVISVNFMKELYVSEEELVIV